MFFLFIVELYECCWRYDIIENSIKATLLLSTINERPEKKLFLTMPKRASYNRTFIHTLIWY